MARILALILTPVECKVHLNLGLSCYPMLGVCFGKGKPEGTKPSCGALAGGKNIGKGWRACRPMPPTTILKPNRVAMFGPTQWENPKLIGAIATSRCHHVVLRLVAWGAGPVCPPPPPPKRFFTCRPNKRRVPSLPLT